MLSIVVYVYKRVKMKNITLFLTFCWILWISQMFAISKILTEVPDGSPMISLEKKPNDLHFETKLDESVRDVLEEEMNQTDSLQLSENQRIDSINDVKNNNAKDEFSSRMLAEKNVIILPEIPNTNSNLSDDGKNDTDSVGQLKQMNQQQYPSIRIADTTKPAMPPTIELNAAADENQIPVFSEWAQKRIEEAEKQVEQEVVNSSTMKRNASLLQKAPVLKLKGAKNYASPDCGAKIIAANSESSSTHYVLTSTKDEYLLSPCKSRIWFVVELCEAIQAEHIDLANFELFSSSPKNFSVSVSSRFPTRDWSNVGKFIAKDERYVQSFDLYPHLFGKYVRVDIHSHYNSEHFCPISLFRVYGISEFEAFETENRPHPIDEIDDDDDEQESDDAKTNSNIFKSASDAVMSIVDTVKKAAAFVKPNENKTDASSSDILAPYSIHSQCRTPNFGLVCARCSEDVASSMAHLLKCKQNIITSLLNVELIRNSIIKSQVCANLVGIDFNMNCRDAIDNTSTMIHLTDLHKDYVSHLFPVSYVAAMCNALAMSNRLFAPQNTTYSLENLNKNITLERNAASTKQLNDESKATQENVPTTEATPNHVESVVESPIQSSTNDAIVGSSVAADDASKKDAPDRQQASQNGRDSDPNSSHTITSQQATSTTTTASTKTIQDETDTVSQQIPQKQNIFNAIPEDTNKDSAAAAEIPTSSEQIESWETIDENILTMTEGTVASSSELQEPADEQTGPGWIIQPHSTGQKLHSESVFLRLSSRIKALERNMSLSGQYLEELSRRYKKQVEDLQSSFTKTLLNIEEQNRRNLGRKQELFEQNQKLRDDLDMLTNRVLSWKNILFWLFCITTVQCIIFYIILQIWTVKYLAPQIYYPPSPEVERPIYVMKKGGSGGGASAKARRKSAEEKRDKHIINGASIQRRPSSEALHISGHYEELLIKDTAPIENIGHENTEEVNDRRNNRNGRKHNEQSAFDDFVKIEDLKELYSKPALNEDYELYGPASDISYNEFVSGVEELDEPNGDNQSTQETENTNGNGSGISGNANKSSAEHNNSSNSRQKSQKNKNKTRRLSSPSFFKAPFSGAGKINNDRSTGWEWHRNKKTNSSQHSKNSKKAKSESPEVFKVNGVVRNDANRTDSPGHKDRSSSDSNSIRTSNASSLDGEKRSSFRRLWKKMF